jgi:hypothetical protein
MFLRADGRGVAQSSPGPPKKGAEVELAPSDPKAQIAALRRLIEEQD